MCETAGSAEGHHHHVVEVHHHVMEANDQIAGRMRQSFAARGVAVLNLISSPGSGKTALLERTLERLKPMRVGVLVGDVETENDAQRLRRYGYPVAQIVTAGTCHLEAQMIESHLPAVEQRDLDLLIIENVGNLVCPTSYDLGEDAKVVLLSTTEGEDKPVKYPAIFHRAELALLTKVDLMPHLDFDRDLLLRNIEQVHPGMTVLEVSSKTGEGLDAWLGWITAKVSEKQKRLV